MTIASRELEHIETPLRADEAVRDSHWHTRAEMTSLPQRHPRPRSRFDPAHVHFNPSWFALGGVSTAVAAAGVYLGGWPVAAGLGCAGALALGYAKRYEPAHPTLERITLRLPNMPAALDGLRVAQLSDTHLGFPYTVDNLAWAIEQVKREKPDLVVLTGDMVHYRRAIPTLLELVRGLQAPLGVYAIPGNHDYWEGIRDVSGALGVAGIPMLINTNRRLIWNGAEFWLAGVDDYWESHADIDEALAGIPRGAFTMMLAHEPDQADDIARRGVALQLSGHTHGGHLRLPLLGQFSAPRFGKRYVMGEYSVGSMRLYVSRGLGGAPLRFFCRPELPIFTLRRG